MNSKGFEYVWSLEGEDYILALEKRTRELVETTTAAIQKNKESMAEWPAIIRGFYEVAGIDYEFVQQLSRNSSETNFDDADSYCLEHDETFNRQRTYAEVAKASLR